MLKQSLRVKHSGWYLFLAVWIAFSNHSVKAQEMSERYKSLINQQAAHAAAQPAKMIARLLTPENHVGGTVRVQIALISMDNQPVTPKQDWKCDVSIRFPSGRSVDQVAWIKKDGPSGEFEFAADEPGLVSVGVRPDSKEIRGDKLEVIVQSAKKASDKKRSSSIQPILRPTITSDASERVVSLRLVGLSSASQNAADTAGERHDHPVATKKEPVLHISAGDVGGTYFANGKDAVTISVIYESPDLMPAPGPIHVWFRWVNGMLDPQPVVIEKGTFSGVTHLTCLRPGDVKVDFVSSTPPYPVEGDADVTAHFVPPLVALLGPEKLSIIDNTPVMIVFLDGQKNPVAPGKKWTVTLHSKQSKLHFGPESFDVPDNSPMGSAQLLPVSWGNDTVEAVVADYNPEPLPIVVTGWMVVGLCLGGGIAGGLVAFNKFKDSWYWRVFLGILGGAALSWMYVFLALPNVGVNLAHSIVSVLFVSMIGGYLGTTVLDFAAKRFGWISA